MARGGKHRGAGSRSRERLREVERLLSNSSAAPWVEPSEGLRESIERSIDESAQSPIPLELPWLRPTRWGGLVAAAVVVGTLGVFGYVLNHPMLSGPSPRVAEVTRPVPTTVVAEATALEVSPMPTLPERGEAIAASVQKPLMDEFGFVRRDAERAVGQVFSRLPFFDPR